MNKSEKVKTWRLKTKLRIVEAMGGKCVCCGYSKCTRAMDLHHINPEEKEFGIGRIMANPTSWDKIVNELRKCVLLCNRCHLEVHSGITDIPKNHAKFNEEFSVYRVFKKDIITYCPECGKEKEYCYVTCSKKCSAIRSNRLKIDWSNIDIDGLLEKYKTYIKVAEQIGVTTASVYVQHKKQKNVKTQEKYKSARKFEITKDELYDLIWIQKVPYREIGRRHNVSDNAVRKRAKSYGIPLPKIKPRKSIKRTL